MDIWTILAIATLLALAIGLISLPFIAANIRNTLENMRINQMKALECLHRIEELHKFK